MTDYKKKYKFDSKDAIKSFVNNGYIIINDAVETKTLKEIIKIFNSNFSKLTALSKKGKIKKDFELWGIIIVRLIEKNPVYKKFLRSEKLINFLKNLLGPDICALGYNSLWINSPTNKNPVLKKTPHVDAWTGTSPNTIFVKLLLTDVDKHNGITVYPGTNLQGLLPVKGRTIDKNLKFKSVNLDNLKKGDLLIWHALTLHSTTGHSSKNQRVSFTTRFSSTETDFSSQERALGYEAITVGPLNQIKRIIGNDLLSPLRTYGGFVGTDKRLKDLYDLSSYDDIEDYLLLLDKHS